MRTVWTLLTLLACAGMLCAALPARAHGASAAVATQPAPPALQVRGELPPEAGITDLKFRDFFKLPIGPRGLEATPRLLALHGQHVRIVGHMVRQDMTPTLTGMLVLTALPVVLTNEDETYADDLPAAAVYVHLAAAQSQLALPHMPGLMALTGTLQVGAQAEPDGRRSIVRLLLDEGVSRLFEPASTATPAFSSFMEKFNESTR